MNRKGFTLPIILVIAALVLPVSVWGWFVLPHQVSPSLLDGSSVSTAQIQSSSVAVSTGPENLSTSTSSFQSQKTESINRTLPNPGSLTIGQIMAYQSCVTDLNMNALPAFYTCKIGQDIGYYDIAGSINSTDTVSFYLYSVPPSNNVGEIWAPTVVTYAPGQIILNECEQKISIEKIDYPGQTFTVEISSGNGACPQ